MAKLESASRARNCAREMLRGGAPNAPAVLSLGF